MEFIPKITVITKPLPNTSARYYMFYHERPRYCSYCGHNS